MNRPDRDVVRKLADLTAAPTIEEMRQARAVELFAATLWIAAFPSGLPEAEASERAKIRWARIGLEFDRREVGSR